MDFSFPINPTLLSLVIAFQNESDTLIADEVLPRIQTGQTFKWTKYGIDSAYTVPDTNVGNKSAPNKVDFGGSEQVGTVKARGLMDSIGGLEMKSFLNMEKPASGGPIDPRQLSAMMLMNLVLLDREIRVANKVFNASVYPAGQQTALSGSSQWSDSTAKAVTLLMNSMDACLVRPNTLVLSRVGWSNLRRNPEMVQSVYKQGTTQGVVTTQAVADVLEIKRVLVGDAQFNTARKGQAPSYSRAWGKHAALIYTNAQAAQLQQPVFGFTAQMGNRIAGDVPNKDIGLEGGVDVKVGEYVEEVICAPETAYFIQNVVP